MNLHTIVAPAIGTVNPFIDATIRVNEGWAVDENYNQVPGYSDPIEVKIQRQALSQKDLAHVANMGIQGVMVSLYVEGDYQGVIRDDGTGGDLFNFDDKEWLVVAVPESWKNWCRVIVCQQLST